MKQDVLTIEVVRAIASFQLISHGHLREGTSFLNGMDITGNGEKSVPNDEMGTIYVIFAQGQSKIISIESQLLNEQRLQICCHLLEESPAVLIVH